MTQVTVTVDDEHLSSIAEVAEALRGQGLEVEQVLDGVGVITGSAADPEALMAVDGVAAVEAAGHFTVPPPDADVQ